MAMDLAETIVRMSTQMQEADRRAEHERRTCTMGKTQMRLHIEVWDDIKYPNAEYFTPTSRNFFLDLCHGSVRFTMKHSEPMVVGQRCGGQIVDNLVQQARESRLICTNSEYMSHSVRMKLVRAKKTKLGKLTYSGKPYMFRSIGPAVPGAPDFDWEAVGRAAHDMFQVAMAIKAE